MPSPERSRRELRNRAKLALWLALPFIGLMLLVSPRGDFPLNDDWVYAKMVQALVDSGHFGLSPFSNAYALTQTLYAAPLVKLFGFSFTLLRLTTIFMGWITVCFTAFTARELGLPNRSAILAALTVFVNPLFINLSYTFMTDVPFCAFASISTYYFVKSFRTPTSAALLAGTIFAIAAFYDRQIGVLIPFAFFLTGTVLVTVRPKPSARIIACIVVPWLLTLVLLVFVRATKTEELVTDLGKGKPDLRILLWFTLISPVAYIGFFLFPIAASYANFGRPERVSRITIPWRRIWIPYFILLVIGGFPFLLFPVLPNIMQVFGVGPALFHFYRPVLPGPLDMMMLWPIAAYISTGAFCVLVGATIRQFNHTGQRHPPVRKAQLFFVIVCGVLFVIAPLLLLPSPYFDRYYLPAVPPFAIATLFLLGFRPRWMRLDLAFVGLGMLGMWSLLGVQDYMAWNTARWKAIDILRTKYEAKDTEINGGFEFNGMYTSEEYLRRLRESPNFDMGRPWWVIESKYYVSPVGRPGRMNPEVLETVQYFSWLRGGTLDFYILGAPHSTPSEAQTTGETESINPQP